MRFSRKKGGFLRKKTNFVMKKSIKFYVEYL